MTEWYEHMIKGCVGNMPALLVFYIGAHVLLGGFLTTSWDGWSNSWYYLYFMKFNKVDL